MAVPEEAVDGGRAYAGRFLAAVFLMMGLSGLFVPAFPWEFFCWQDTAKAGRQPY